MPREKRSDDQIGTALAYASRVESDLLKDVASRVMWTGFPGTKLEEFRCLKSLALRDLWSSEDDIAICQRFDEDFPLTAGWGPEDLEIERRKPLYKKIKKRLGEEMEAASAGSNFKSLADDNDPMSGVAARSMRILTQEGSERTKADLLREVYQRAHPTSQPGVGFVFQLPPEALELMQRTEKRIKQTGVELLPPAEEED